MTLRWLTCFSLAVFSLMPATLSAATVSGRVELRDSRDPAVRNRMDYSGVVVSLKPANGAPAAAHARATMLQKDKMFTPHVLAIPAGAVVEFPNADPIFHNAFSSYSGQVFDIGLYPPGSTRSVRFAREGVVRVFCNIHAAMSAVIVVVATPHYAVSKRDGTFEIPNVPPGEYQLSVFHERAAESTLTALERKVTVAAENQALPLLAISEAGYLSIPHKNKYGHEYMPDHADPTKYPGRP
jgi:plastocyanin